MKCDSIPLNFALYGTSTGIQTQIEGFVVLQSIQLAYRGIKTPRLIQRVRIRSSMFERLLFESFMEHLVDLETTCTAWKAVILAFEL